MGIGLLLGLLAALAVAGAAYGVVLFRSGRGSPPTWPWPWRSGPPGPARSAPPWTGSGCATPRSCCG
ncbi:hypothetical protein NKH77_33510 [Streptomyces sp. M19]